MISWRFIGFVVLGSFACAAPAPNAALVLAAKVTGEVMVEVGGDRRPVAVDERIPEGAVVTTSESAHAVFILSNGTTLQLAAGGQLRFAEFFQEPFSGTIKVATMTHEPSLSRTRVLLERGELTAALKILDPKSMFDVQTPFGVVRPRGDTATTFALACQSRHFRATSAGGELLIGPTAGGTPVIVAPGKTIEFSVQIDSAGGGSSRATATGK